MCVCLLFCSCHRSASFSQATRSNLFVGSDSAVQKLPHGFSHCLNGMGAHLHGFYSLPKPGKHQLSLHDDSPQEPCYVLPRGYSSEAPAHSSLGTADIENEEVYTFKTPCNALATMQGNERPNDNYDIPTPPGSFYQIPRTFDKNHNALTPSSSDSSCAPPPRPPKPSQGSEGQWGSPHSVDSQNGELTSAVSVIPRRNTLPAVENIRLHRGTPNANSGIAVFSKDIPPETHVSLSPLTCRDLLKLHPLPVSCFFKMQVELDRFILLWYCNYFLLPLPPPAPVSFALSLFLYLSLYCFDTSG